MALSPIFPQLESANGELRVSDHDALKRTDAEIAANVTPVNYAFPTGDVRRYGAVGDGETDDAEAINTAFSILGVIVRLPAGDYWIASNLDVPVCAGIVGDGWYDTEIIAATGVTTALSLTGSTAFRCSGFRITGNATTNARGIVIGDASLTSNIRLEDIWVQGFTGSGAIGVWVQDVVTLLMINPYLNGNRVNLQVGGSSGFPTTIQVIGGAIRTAITKGCVVTSGYSVRFTGTVFESNTHEGLFVQTASGRLIEDLLVDGDSWFEDNYHAHVDTGIQVYSAIVNGTTASATAIFRDVRFSQGGILSDRKSLQINKASVTLDNVRAYFGFAAEITVVNALSYVQVIGDIADRCGRFISNPDGAQVVTPVFNPIIDNGDGTSKVQSSVNTFVSVAYSTSMTVNSAAGDQFTISATNGTAFAINAPSNPLLGRRITFIIRNASGGALGVATWNAVFKLSAWTQPANANSRSITFRYDAVNWVELNRTTVDVPN
jgi:hypothetical protein